jgi:integral membrane sensor domain MASE1
MVNSVADPDEQTVNVAEHVTPSPTATARTVVRSEVPRVLTVFVSFVIFAVLAWESFGSAGGPSFFYPGAGVSVAAMILNRRALWPWIAFAVIVGEVVVDTMYSSPPWLSGTFAAANVVEPVIGTTLVLAWCGGRPDLRKRRDFVFFIVGACLIAPVFGALIGGTASSQHGGLPWLEATATWWAGDALGVLVMASPILLWPLQSYVLRRRPWEAAAVLTITGLVSVATYWTELPPSILILPLLAWAGFRLDMLGAAVAGAVSALLANIMTTHGRGLFIDAALSPGVRIALTQVYVAVIVVVAMVIAQEAAARMQAVRAQEAERRERIRLETLSKLALELSAALTPREIGRALEDQVRNEAGAQELYLGLVSADGEYLEWVSGRWLQPDDESPVPLSQRTVGTDVIRYGRPVELPDPARYAAAYPEAADWPQRVGAEAIVGWPLSSGGEPFGALVMNWSEPQPLNAAQLAYISAVATMASQALIRAKAYTDERARAAVLHSVAQPLDQVEVTGLEYRALYQPAESAYGLGGDWYSVLALPDGKTYFSVGDVIGHGLLSVEDMARLRSAGNAYAHMGLSAAQILNEMNRYAAHQIGGEFATNLIAIFDPECSTLSFSSAGHPPALLRRAATGEVLRLEGASGPMLGPFDDTVYLSATVAADPGDVLVMYTDGLVEHHDEDLRAGIAHLQQVVSSWPPEALLDCESLARDVAPAPYADDICLLIVRFGTHN